ncbi:ATP-binding protein [Streptomyces sp. NPDC052301]|uniref:ATP-binding protein n=1 Tax=Streptomyces sp. NPDC052301 TaxID=3365687 RepID=UPI0037D0A411
MSHLRAPAGRADRREGGRHGRPVARPAPALPETHIRPQLMRLAVLPPLAVALSATAAVLFSIRSTGARTGPVLWAVLAGAVTVAVAGILIAAVAADRAARSVTERVDALRRTAARGEADLHALVDALRQGETPPQRSPRRRPPEDADDFELLAADLARAHDGAVTAVVRAAQLSSQAGSEQKLEVFVNLARRLQSLVHREIATLDELENEIEDPDLLKGLFHVDHLATRIRRHAENLAVLGGAVSRRQWSNPVNMTEVLRSAIAEVEQYSRVKLVPPIDGELRGHAVADVIHLLAELIENATVFSAPHTQVLLRANLVTSGLAVEVEDRGLGMPVGEQNKMNALLADPDQVNVASLLADGRIGLYVVSQLARRHGITVRLQSNIYGGVQAVLVVPQALLGSAPGVPGAAAGAALPQQPPAPAAIGVPRQAQAPGPVQAPGKRPGAGNSAQSGTGAESGGGTGPGAPAVPDAGPAPAAGRRRHAQRGSGERGRGAREGTERESARRASDRSGAGQRGFGQPGSGDTEREDAPAPLPVRGAGEVRPTPAEAVPGINAADRQAIEAHAGVLPTPRTGAVRGTMGKPQLPRRRAQEHLVPQLRGGPAPRQEADTVADHDPGLMAAFQRGIGLAEAQQCAEPTEAEARGGRPAFVTPAYGEPQPRGAIDSAHMGSAHTGSARGDSAHTEAPPMGPAHRDAHHMAPDHTASPHTGPDHRAAPHTAADHTAADSMAPHHMAAQHMSPDHMAPNHMAPHPDGQPPTGAAPMDPSPIPGARTHAPVSDGTRGTGRADGSAPDG